MNHSMNKQRTDSVTGEACASLRTRTQWAAAAAPADAGMAQYHVAHTKVSRAGYLHPAMGHGTAQ